MQDKTGTLSPEADLIASFPPAEQLQPAAESGNAPTSSAQQYQAKADEQHIAFCFHLYSLLGRAQALCLEQTPKEHAVIKPDVPQAAGSTQEVARGVQGTCVDDSMQGVSGVAASVAATAVGSEVHDLPAPHSAMVVHGDSYLGSPAAAAADPVCMAAALAEVMQGRMCDRDSPAVAATSQQCSAQTNSGQLLQTEIDSPEEELAALEDANQAARLLYRHRLSFSSSHRAARPDRLEQAAIEQAMALSMENTIQAGLEKSSPQLHAVPSGSSGSGHLVPSTALAYPPAAESFKSAEPQCSIQERLMSWMGPVKPLVGPAQSTDALVRAFQHSPHVHKNLKNLNYIFPNFREIRGTHLAQQIKLVTCCQSSSTLTK